MGMVKWIYKETKDSVRSLKRDITDIASYFYYGYIRKDEFGKNEFKFALYRAWSDLTTPFRQIKSGCQNISKWWMIIWEDRDFDYGYMETILNHKLKMMEDFFYSDKTHIEDAEKYGAEIKECREILDSLSNETYNDEIYKEYYDKYPFKGIKFLPCESEKERIEKGLPVRTYEMVNDDTDEQRKMFKECMDKADAKKIELRTKLYTILNEKSEGWWD